MTSMFFRRSPNSINIYEVQFLQNGQTCKAAFEACAKIKGHEHYIEVADTIRIVDCLSQLCPTTDVSLARFTDVMARLTAKIEVPIYGGVRCGTGFVQKVETVTNKPCPCPHCKGLCEIQWGQVTMTTALCVLAEEADATRCEVRLFYDSDNSGDQETIIHGQKSHSRDEKGDWCALVCLTHDLDLLRDLDNMLKKYWTLGHSLKEKYRDGKDNVVVVVSHPHGGPKRVAVGKVRGRDIARDVREDQDWCFYCYDAATCDGSSGAPVYVLGRWNDGFGYWFGHSHNHSGIDCRMLNRSTVGVDSTYDRVLQFSSRGGYPV